MHFGARHVIEAVVSSGQVRSLSLTCVDTLEKGRSAGVYATSCKHNHVGVHLSIAHELYAILCERLDFINGVRHLPRFGQAEKGIVTLACMVAELLSVYLCHDKRCCVTSGLLYHKNALDGSTATGW